MEGTSALQLLPFEGSAVSQHGIHKTRPRVSLVIPAWNEEETIAQAIHEADSALKVHASQYEIIIVDDGSTDRTNELILAEAAVHRAVQTVEHGENRGYGAALRSGFEAARYELVAFTDADSQFNLNDLDYMLPLAEHYDVVSGYRMDRKDSRVRRFYSWGYNTLVQFLFGSPIRDIDCALKVFHRRQIKAILPESDNFFANTEILSKARAQGLSIVEVGVRHRPRAAGRSKVSCRAIPNTLRSLLPFWWMRTLFAGGDTATAEPSRFYWPALVLLLAVAALMIFPRLSYPLLEPDEGRYAEIPREMVIGGDWVVPHLMNEPYLDKPPMFYWLCAASYQLFGPIDWAARLVPATAAFLTAICTFVFGSRILGLRSAFLGSLALTLSIGFAFCGRFLNLDSVLAFFVVASLFSAYEAISGERLRWFWWIASAIACGLGVLTKGPVAIVLLVPPVAAHAWLSKRRAQPRLTHWGAYAAVVLGVAVPWYAAIVIRDPQFAYHFFWEHNVVRFLSGVQHPHAAWYYVPVALLAWMPWGLLLFPLGIFLFARSKSLSRLRPIPLGYFVLWAGWCLLFFSLSAGKLPPYILPAFPAIALLLGFMLAQVSLAPEAGGRLHGILDRMLRQGMLLFCIAGLVLSIGAGLLQWDAPWAATSKTSIWILGSLGLFRFRKTLTSHAVVSICGILAFATLGDVVRQGIPAWADRYSSLPISSPNITEQLRNKAIPVVCFGEECLSIPFYLGRDDIEHLSSICTEELSRFVRERGRAYVILDNTVAVDAVRAMLPKGTSISTTSASPRSTILFVRTLDEQRAAGWQTTAN